MKTVTEWHFLHCGAQQEANTTTHDPDSLDLGQRDAAKLDYFCGVPGKQFTNLGDRR
jgi:hypothetical protein